MPKNKQNSKRINSFFLIYATLAASLQASDHFSDHLKEPHLTSRERRLQLLGFDKFDSSFNLSSNVSVQMKDRNSIWGQPNTNFCIRDEIMRYTPTQNKIFDYTLPYFKKILDVESTEDLKVKGEYFSDFINLVGTLHRDLKGTRQMKKLEEKLLDIDLKQYPLSSIFFRYLAFKKDDFVYADYPSFMQQRIDRICLNDQFNKPYNYHRSLKENCKMDKDQLDKVSSFQTLSKEYLKAHIDVYYEQIISDYR